MCMRIVAYLAYHGRGTVAFGPVIGTIYGFSLADFSWWLFGLYVVLVIGLYKALTYLTESDKAIGTSGYRVVDFLLGHLSASIIFVLPLMLFHLVAGDAAVWIAEHLKTFFVLLLSVGVLFSSTILAYAEHKAKQMN